MKRDIDTLIRRLTPVTDARVGRLLSDEDADALAERITSTATATAVVPAEPRGRRGLVTVVGLPLAVAAAAAAVAVVVAQDDPAKSNPEVKPVAAALSFTPKGDHIDVRVRDPLADPKRYRAEFAARGLDVSLTLVPASPSIVGTVVMESTSEGTPEDAVRAITAKGACETGGGGDECPVGVRISTDYKGTAEIVFGRAARPGELYNSSAPVSAPGEAMHGMEFRNHRVGDVLAALKKRNVTVPEYRAETGKESNDLPPDQVPADWYVHDGAAWARNQVLLFVGPSPSE
ncbi:hypothetical protein OHR68_04865 [Spirillospora sp. NBC_00431]